MAFLFERAPGISKEVDDWSVTVREFGGMEPQTVIRDTQAWDINVRFQEQGAAFLVGNWVVDAYVESIGGGVEVHLGQAVSPIANAPIVHTLVIPVPPGVPGVLAGHETTPYKLVVTLTANTGTGFQWAMAGFEEGPILQFFHPV